MSLVLSNKGKGMQSSSEQPLVGEERYVTTRITAAKETRQWSVKVLKRLYKFLLLENVCLHETHVSLTIFLSRYSI